MAPIGQQTDVSLITAQLHGEVSLVCVCAQLFERYLTTAYRDTIEVVYADPKDDMCADPKEAKRQRNREWYTKYKDKIL